jgi:serine protease AprX
VFRSKRVIASSTGKVAAKFGLTGFLVAAALAGANATSIEYKADSSVKNQLRLDKKSGWTSVIIKLDGGLTPAHVAKLTALKADLYRRLNLVQSVAVRVPNRNLRKLASLPFVERISIDSGVRKYDDTTVGRTGANVAFDNYNLTGNGVTIAVIDSGIDNHPDLRDPKTGISRVIASKSFVALGGTNDLNGHGTHVAGILAGNGAASTGNNFTRSFYGIARKSNIVNVRVLDGLGRTDVSTVIAGVQWVVENRQKYNIRVINMSLGHPVGESYTTDPLCIAVEKAWKAGIVVVVAAGNDGRSINLPIPIPGKDNEGYGTKYGSIGAPANSPYVITVGAMRTVDGDRNHDTIATYSSRGPSRLDYIVKPDICAPGNKVVSLRRPLSFLELTSLANIVPVKSYRKNPPLLAGSDYFELSGTSMAAPVVAGAAALLLEANPGLSPDTIKARLMATADKWADKNGNEDITAYGAGYLNIPEALQSALVAKSYARSPFMTKDAQGNFLMSNEGLLNNLWGTGLGLDSILGTSATGGKPLLTPRAMWGINEVWADRAMWGIDQFSINLGIITLFGE